MKRNSGLYSIAAIILLFVVSRFLLEVSGLIGNQIFHSVSTNQSEWNETNTHIPAIDMWGVWDSGWYLNIAQNGYVNAVPSDIPWTESHGQTNYGFFPLYPFLIKITSYWIGNFFLSGLLVSNFFCILSLVFLQKVIAKQSDNQIAKRTVKYLILFPTSFILSAVFSESLFLFLSILTFYLAQKRRWALVGIVGFFLALSRPTGFLVSIPLLYLLIKERSFTLPPKKNILYLALFPTGLSLFLLYCAVTTRDPLMYFHIQQSAWGVHRQNPLQAISLLMKISPITSSITTLMCLQFAFLLSGIRKLPLEYTLFILVTIGLAFIEGPGPLFSIPRMSAAVFPLPFLLALLIQNKKTDKIITVYLVIFQAFCMILWSNGMGII